MADVPEYLALIELVADARLRWQAWVEDLAAGRPAPAPPAVLEIGAILDIRHPGAALEAAAEAERARGPGRTPSNS